MTAENTGHGWVLARLHAQAAGLLDERDEARLLAHLESCDECRAEAGQDQPLDAEELEDARHLPPRLIAQWKSTALEGLEREMVRAHLARCAECRRDLEMLGHSAELSAAASGPAGNGVARAARSDLSGPAHRIAEPATGSRRGWVHWAVGAWAVAASWIAVTLALRSPAPETPGLMPPHASAERPAPNAQGPAAAGEALSFSRSGRMVRLTSPERGVENDGVLTISLGPGEQALRLVIEPLIDVPPDAPVLIQLLAAGGRKHAEIRVPHREAVHPDRGVHFRVEPQLLEETEPLTLLASAVAAAGAPASEPETASYRIRFRRER